MDYYFIYYVESKRINFSTRLSSECEIFHTEKKKKIKNYYIK